MIFAVIWPFSAMEMTGMIATLRAGGDGKTGFITDIFTMWLITIPLAALGAFVLDLSPLRGDIHHQVQYCVRSLGGNLENPLYEVGQESHGGLNKENLITLPKKGGTRL